MARPGQAILGQRVQVISQPGIRKAALRYLTTVAAGRPRNGGLRAGSLIIFAEYLAAAIGDPQPISSPAPTSKDSWPTTTNGPGGAGSPATSPSPSPSASGP